MMINKSINIFMGMKSNYEKNITYCYSYCEYNNNVVNYIGFIDYSTYNQLNRIDIG